MCGIAGILWSDNNRSVEPALLKSMGDAIAHRGPDAEGFWSENGVGLAHRRLSIIDLAGGDQPIANEDGSVQVVFNGEIYNYETLRRDLAGRGHVFRTHSDTEVLVHLYEELGDRLVERLRGMFAFAIWDRKKRSLLLARDRLGIKPLYIFRDAQALVFGSEPKAILASGRCDREVDPCALDEYLAFGVVPGPRSVFRRIEKLPPASTLVVTPDDLHARPRRYWTIRFSPDYRTTIDQWKERIAEKVREAVRLHMIADVPVGAFLSGGVDSSIVVACATELMSDPLSTFTMGFDDRRFNEVEYAREVARLCKTTHTEETVRPNAADLLERLMCYYDEPFADPSAIPTYLVSRLAARQVKVVLTGDGGDEAFGGYRRYRHDLWEGGLRDILPPWLRRSLIGPMSKIWPQGSFLPRFARWKVGLSNLSLDAPQAYANTIMQCRGSQRHELLHPDVRAQLNGHDPSATVTRSYEEASSSSSLDAMIGADIEMLLPDDFLVKVDRASMANGLEARPPLLDHELFELAATVPMDLRIRGRRTKWILKESFRQRFPDGFFERPKQGFDVPIDQWLCGPLKEMFQDAVLGPSSPVSDLLDVAAVRRLFESHCSGWSQNGKVLWSVLILARWAERYRSASRSPTAACPRPVG